MSIPTISNIDWISMMVFSSPYATKKSTRDIDSHLDHWQQRQ